MPDHYLTFIMSYERRNLSDRFLPIGFLVTLDRAGFYEFFYHRTNVCESIIREKFMAIVILEYIFFTLGAFFVILHLPFENVDF